jgi:hypothetical protein
MPSINIPNGRQFEDKFDYLTALLEIAGRVSRLDPSKSVVCFVEDDFFTKVGLNITIPRVEFIACGPGFDPARIDYDADATIAVYAIQHASIGLPIAQALIAKNIKFITAGGARTGGFAYDDKAARQVIEAAFIAQTVQGFAKFEDPGTNEDFANLCQALLYTNTIPGDVVEVGCFRGSSGAMMLEYAAQKKLKPKTFRFFDVFSGFDYPEAIKSTDANRANTHATEGQAVVAERLKSRAGENIVHVEKMNIISDDIPAAVTQISLCNLDVDLYEAVHAGLFRLAPLISIGGIMICEDAGHLPALIGARVALQEFIESDAGKAFTPVHQTSGQVFLVKHS